MKKLQSLMLGKYNQEDVFNLYRFEDSSTLLFKLSDIISLFNLQQTALETKDVYKDKYQPFDVYVTTTELTKLSIKNNKFLLAELCKLKQNDYSANLDESIISKLKNFTYLKSKKNEFTTTNIQLTQEPVLSSTSVNHSETKLNGAGSQQSGRRLSRVFEDQPNKKSKINHPNDQPTPILPKPIHTVSSQNPATVSTLLAKRLNNNLNGSSNSKNTRHLTIYTPSYNEQINSVKSAPLNSNFRISNNKPIQPTPHQPHPLSQATMLSASSNETEFAIPPIVPSQQQQQQQQQQHTHTHHPHPHHHPPHTAHPSSLQNHHFQPQSPQYPITSKPANKRPQFLQPFENLFDTIEQTRTLKSTLDDQIRKSSNLIQQLQSTAIEELVRNQVKVESQKKQERIHALEVNLDDLFGRIATLEKKVNSNKLEKDGNSLVDPLIVIQSQKKTQSNEYFQMLNTLRERLDKLEKQIES